MLAGLVRTFTHFHLELRYRACHVDDRTTGRAGATSSVWCPIDLLTERARGVVMRKVIAHRKGLEAALTCWRR